MRLKLDKRTGPLYWCTYEKQFTENTFMPEERFKENIDWVAKEFVPYGYEMVCTDGWIEDSFRCEKLQICRMFIMEKMRKK